MSARHRSRLAPWGFIAWILPLALLAASLAPAAAMFCRMRNTVVAAGCCCGVAQRAAAGSAFSAEAQPAHLDRQRCCETQPQAALLPSATRAEHTAEAIVPVAGLVTLVVLPPILPPAAAPAWTLRSAMREPGRPLVLLKHALLV